LKQPIDVIVSKCKFW